jgi:hypothetical protein
MLSRLLGRFAATLAIAALLLGATFLANATTETSTSVQSSFQYHLQVGPKLVPVSAADVVVGDVYLQEISLANNSGSPVTVTITDKQGSPLAIIPAVSIAANTVYEMSFGLRYCPGGITWSASSGTVVTGYVRWRQ